MRCSLYKPTKEYEKLLKEMREKHKDTKGFTIYIVEITNIKENRSGLHLYDEDFNAVYTEISNSILAFRPSISSLFRKVTNKLELESFALITGEARILSYETEAIRS